MIEKCAAVFFEWFDEEYQGAYRPNFSALSDLQKEPYINAMREVLEIMKHPTGKMIMAADEALVPAFDANAAWQAMIDAILANKGE